MRPTEFARYTPAPARPAFYVDQSLQDLGFAARFIVWAMRVQWSHIGDGIERSLVVERACNAADMPEGGALIAELTGALIGASSRPLAFPCPKWRVLTGDEARLLAFIAALQARDGTPLAVCDAEWRSPRHASSVWAPAQRLALALSAAGFYLAMPASQEAAPADAASCYH